MGRFNEGHIFIKCQRKIVHKYVARKRVNFFAVKEHWQAHTGRIRSAVFVDDSVWTTSIDGITVWDASFTNPNVSKKSGRIQINVVACAEA